MPHEIGVDIVAEEKHRRALRLIADITRCPAVEAVWLDDAGHRCRKVVETQESDPTLFQVPEPWAGHLHLAPILLVSSNPSISADEPYPTWDADADHRVRFFDERFGDQPGQVKDGVRFPLKEQAPDGSWHSRRPVAFWRDCLANVSFLLGRPAEPGFDYAMTEVVHCKSREEEGVAQAVDACVRRWFTRVLEVSPAPVVVLLGRQAVSAVERHLGQALPLWQITEASLGGRQRLVVAVRHPNYHGPRRWEDLLDPNTVARLREAATAADGAPVSTVANTSSPIIEQSTAPQPDDRIVVALPPVVSSLLTRVHDSDPDRVILEVDPGRVSLHTDNGVAFLSASGNSDGALVVFRLGQGDAERAHVELGGQVVEAADAPHLRELLVDEIDIANAADAFYVLGLRALHATELAPVADDLTVDDVVYAVAEARRFDHGPTDMHLYWNARRDALWELFDLPQAADPSDHDRTAALHMIEHAAAALDRPSSPLAGVYEAPPKAAATMAPYVDDFEAMEERRQQLGRAWIRDLLALLNPDALERVVPMAELTARGVAAEPPRDALELMMDGWF